jgi:hypothetical protein
VRPSDIVKAVDSVRVGRRHGYALDNVKKLILGPPDTAVTLTLIRSQSEFDVIITRAPPRMSAAHFSSGASSANATAPLVSTASAFAPSAASLHQAPEDHRKRLQRSNSLPVRSAPDEHDVRNSGGHFKVQVEYQVKERTSGCLPFSMQAHAAQHLQFATRRSPFLLWLRRACLSDSDSILACRQKWGTS